MTIRVLDQDFSVCKVPSWDGVDLSSPVVFTGATGDEKSLVCPSGRVPSSALAREDGWRAFRIEGTLDFSLVGILSRISGILAGERIALFAVSTFDTDYILVKAENLDRALAALAAEGCEIVGARRLPAAAPGFRPMRRANQALSDAEIREVLRSAKRGVLSAIGDGGWPYGTWLNPHYDEESGRIYFHGGKIGHRVDALRKNPRACFTVVGEGFHDASREPAWALTFKSVVVFGHVEFVDDFDEAVEICRRLSRRFTPDERYIEEEIRKAAAAVLVFALVPDHITGKRVHEA